MKAAHLHPAKHGASWRTKSQVQALGRSQPAFPMMPGMPEKRTHDYVRNGTTSLNPPGESGDSMLIETMLPH